jgi:hypothetical protein
MAATIFFTNGHRVTMKTATEVGRANILFGSGLSSAIPGIECKDKAGRVVATFRYDQLIGYVVHDDLRIVAESTGDYPVTDHISP